MKRVAFQDVIRVVLASFACKLALLLAAGIPSVQAQEPAATVQDPNLAHPTKVVTVAGKGYTLAGLVTHLEGVKTFKHGIALFPGFPGIMKLREENGQAAFEMRGNFLVRSRRNWLDEETLVVTS